MTHPFLDGGTHELLVVGDTHCQWDDVDRQFVEAGRQDVVLFVGDLADEDIEIVTRIAALTCRKAIVLGNHDAWNASRSGDVSVLSAMSEVLGDAHLAYRLMPLDDGLAILGARPYSWGGPWAHWRKLYEALGLPASAEASAAAITAAAAAPADDADESGARDRALVVLAHNGPSGLGATRDAPFGRDFRRPAIDWGDEDLRMALDQLRESGRRVPLVVAGHMHDRLCGGGQRKRVARDGETLVLNAAVVPRHTADANGGRLRHYLRVRLERDVVVSAEDVWVDDSATVARTVALTI